MQSDLDLRLRLGLFKVALMVASAIGHGPAAGPEPTAAGRRSHVMMGASSAGSRLHPVAPAIAGCCRACRQVRLVASLRSEADPQ